jgi:hypothetical protein
LCKGVSASADLLEDLVRGRVPDEGFRVVVAVRGAIVVRPTREDLTGPEIALLGGFEDQRWMCWRPGEDSFEDLA